MVLDKLRRDLRRIADSKKAELLQGFFKTGKGEYGEGDVFLGITVPQLRQIAKKYYSLEIKQLKELIASKFHEERLIALFILINKYETTNHKKICFHFYIKNMKYINNWDLVDLSAPRIVGEFLFNLFWGPVDRFTSASAPHSRQEPLRPYHSEMRAVGRLLSRATPHLLSSSENELPRLLLKLACSKNIWERRITVLATFWFIKNNRFGESLKLAEILLKDEHDLIHKAVGWMLREIGKRDLKTEIEFLNQHYKKMPRTMLRYAIERLPKSTRIAYLQGKT